MNSYEVTVVLPAGGKDKEILVRLEKEIKDVDGKIEKTEEWGKRELAYAIKKHGGPAGGYREGIYHYFEVMLEPDKVGGINRSLETNEGILRHLIVRTKPKVQMISVKSSSKPKIKKTESKKVVKKRNGNKES